jgi:ABC-type transport system involved in multi-copper enzyme maturation permease subunit
MGLNPIEYRSWKGQRSEHGRRPLIIAGKVVQQKLGSKWLLGLLILGGFLVHGMSLLFMSITPHQSLTPEAMAGQMQGAMFYIFAIILVAMTCGDLLAEDLRASSLVLYLSRAIGASGYLLGKLLGAAIVIGIFTLALPLVLACAVTATQSGGDYAASLEVIGRTVAAGAWTMVLLMPVGLLFSSLTSKKTYAAIGAFMTFFVLEIIGSFLSRFDANWAILGPQSLLSHSFEIIYGLKVTGGVDVWLMALISIVLIVPPAIITYLRVHKVEVGR